MAVQVQQEQIDHCRVALTIEVPPEEIQKAVETVFNQFAKRTNVPGFRPGKAPRNLVKRFIDEDRVRELAMDQALTNAYRDALKQSGVHPYTHAEPQVELPEEEVDPEKGFSFKATVATQPHVHLGDLEGLSGKKVVTQITDDEVAREIARYRENAVTFEPTEEPAELGDRVRAVVNVAIEGEAEPEISFTEPTLLQLGTNLPQFDEGLVGTRAGEEKTFQFTYPDDFQDESRRGKTATATVAVSEVHRRTIPGETDEFAVTAGFENLEALRTRVREALQAQADALAEQELNDHLIQEVVTRSTVHYPEEMIDREVSDRMTNLMQALERRSLTLEDYLAAQKTDLPTLQASLRDEALESVKTTLVLIDFAHENQIGVTDKDVEEEVKRRAEAENVKVSQMRRLLNDTGEINDIRNRIYVRKITEQLRQKAAIEEVAA